jgi:hypothetical protein
MENYYFMRVVLNWLARPRNFNRMIAITLRVLAVLIVPLSLVTFFKAGKVIFDLPPSGILGGILFQMFYVTSIYCVVHGLFIRAREIHGLPDSAYNMYSMTALLLKGVGEALAAFIALIAVGGGVFVWFTAKSIGAILNPPPMFLPVFGDTSFMGGIEFMAGGVLSAIMVLVVAYLAAEGLNLLGAHGRRVSEARHIPSHAESPVTLRSGTGS